MILQTRVIFFLLFSLMLFSLPVSAQETLPDLIARIKPAVVKIIVYDKEGKKIATGSGFYVSSNKIVTNKHVIEDAFKVEIQTSDNNTIPVSKISSAENTDLSLLESSTENTQIRPLIIAKNTPREGDKIVVVGSPLGLSGSVSDGIISAFRTLSGVGRLLQITAPISHGSSGSPVINLSGQVVGVATLNLEGGQNLNFAISSEEIKNSWKNYITTEITSDDVQSQLKSNTSAKQKIGKLQGYYDSTRTIERFNIIDDGEKVLVRHHMERDQSVWLEANWEGDFAVGYHLVYKYYYFLKAADSNHIWVWIVNGKLTTPKEKILQILNKKTKKEPDEVWSRVR